MEFENMMMYDATSYEGSGFLESGYDYGFGDSSDIVAVAQEAGLLDDLLDVNNVFTELESYSALPDKDHIYMEENLAMNLIGADIADPESAAMAHSFLEEIDLIMFDDMEGSSDQSSPDTSSQSEIATVGTDDSVRSANMGVGRGSSMTEKKRQQNREAAKRYREKKKNESTQFCSFKDQLKRENGSLESKINRLRDQVKALESELLNVYCMPPAILVD